MAPPHRVEQEHAGLSTTSPQRAVDRFEPERGANFLSFAIPTMTGEVLRHFRDRSDTIRLPRRLLDPTCRAILLLRLARLRERLTSEL